MNNQINGSSSNTATNTTSGTTQINAMNTTSPNFNISSAGTTSMNQYYPRELKNVVVTEETIEITYIKRAAYSYTQTITIAGYGYPVSPPDIVIKEIYGTRDGRLTLLKTVEGKVIPPQSLPESYEFDE